MYVCYYYRVTVTKSVMVDVCSPSRVEELFAALLGDKYFTKLASMPPTSVATGFCHLDYRSVSFG